MASKNRYISGLDLGSSKTCALICQPGEEGKLAVAGMGVAESKGWRKGVIANLDLTVLAIKKAVDAAEAAAGVPFDSAYVGVGGAHIKGVNSSGSISLVKPGGTDREVTRDDVARVVQTARGITLPPDCELLHVLPLGYSVDSHAGIRDPLGMSGSRLEVNVHLVTASATATQNVVTVANRAGIVVQDTVYEALASAEACLSMDERELGVALADIGGGSTDLVIYYHGTVRYTGVIPVGGDHFTNDIAVGLRTPIPEAEKMKRAWGERDSDKPVEADLEVQSVGERPARVVSYGTLNEIIEPRACEWVELVQEELTRAGFDRQLGAGLVLTGGGARLGGLVPLAEQVLGLPVRLGLPKGLAKMGEALPDPAFAAVVGLILYGNRVRLLRDTRDENWFGKLRSVFRGKAS